MAKQFGAIFPVSDEPERLVSYAQKVERAWFTELRIIEDCFFADGVSTATLALTAAGRLSAGITIMPRAHAEPGSQRDGTGTTARYFPGRLLPGPGHGIPAWSGRSGRCRHRNWPHRRRPPAQCAAAGRRASHRARPAR